MLFLYTVGKMEPKSAGSPLEDSPNSILHLSKMISSSESDWRDRCAWAPLETASDSRTSHRLPLSSKITKLWLFVRPLPSRNVSIMRGGGRFSVALLALQVKS